MNFKITQTMLANLARQSAALISDETGRTEFKVYPIPRGGVPAALALLRFMPKSVLVDDPSEADLLFDDLIDSGTTFERWTAKYPGVPFHSLIDKRDQYWQGKWIIFPWEGGADPTAGVEDNVARLLQAFDPKPDRGGLVETPARVAKAWKFWTSGYSQDPSEILKVFEDGSENYDEMVTVKDIPIYSHCEHHMAAIFGKATISYIPDGRIVGLSKLSRLADVFSRRFQVQERLTCQIADSLVEHLKPKGVGVVIRARHMCMESRGVCQQGHHTMTTALRGVIKDDPTARAEFLRGAE